MRTENREDRFKTNIVSNKVVHEILWKVKGRISSLGLQGEWGRSQAEEWWPSWISTLNKSSANREEEEIRSGLVSMVTMWTEGVTGRGRLSFKAEVIFSAWMKKEECWRLVLSLLRSPDMFGSSKQLIITGMMRLRKESCKHTLKILIYMSFHRFCHFPYILSLYTRCDNNKCVS